MTRRSGTVGATAKAAMVALVYGIVGLVWLRAADWVMEAVGMRWLERYADLALIAGACLALYLVLMRHFVAAPAPGGREPANDDATPAWRRQRSRSGAVALPPPRSVLEPGLASRSGDAAK